MDLRLKMMNSIKKIMITLSVFLVFLMIPSFESRAAVKTMPDGMLFDPSFYAATYNDVYKAFGMNEALLYQHYLLCGIKEKRLPYAGYEYKDKEKDSSSSKKEQDTVLAMPDGTRFDPVFYAKKYPDVVSVYGNVPLNLYNHYYYLGINEGRLPYEGYDPDDMSLTFTTALAIADPSNQNEFIYAIRQAGKYRIPKLQIQSRWHGVMSAEDMTLLANTQIAYMKNVYGVKKMTFDVPKVYGDKNSPVIEMNLTFKF